MNRRRDLQRDLAKFLEVCDPEHNPFPAIGEAVSGIARADEQSADKAAFYFLYKTGYNPVALADYFHRVPDLTLQYVKSEAGAAWPVFWTLAVLFDSHPPNSSRGMALDWELNFVAKVPRNSRADPTAFNTMKSRLKYLDEEDAKKAREAQEKMKALKNKPGAAPVR